MTWGLPQVGDIVWCRVPYDHADGTTSLVRHPALVVAVDSGQMGGKKDGSNAPALVQVAVMGGTSFRKTEWGRIKRARKAWDLLLQANDTLFHMQRRYVLPYTDEHFFAPAGGSPKMGFLDGSHAELRERLRRALLAGTEAKTSQRESP